jgi:hypothetical protein
MNAASGHLLRWGLTSRSEVKARSAGRSHNR